jgi:hypothetical protein
MSRPLAALAVLTLAGTARGYTEPPWQSYSRTSPDKAFVFVVLHGPRPGEPPDPLAAKYPASGLYRNDGSTAPLWTFPGGYVRDAYPASDGVHVVVLLERVITIHPGPDTDGPPEPPDPAVLAVYANGVKVRTVRLGELLDHVRFGRERDPGWHPWLASAAIDDAGRAFVVETVGGRRTVLDLETGYPVGYGTGPRVGSPWGLALGIVLAAVAAAGAAVAGYILYRAAADRPGSGP